MKTRVVKVRSSNQTASAGKAARAIAAGKLVGFATETVYGIAALATNDETMARLRELKNRPRRPFSFHVGRRQDVGRYVAHVPPGAQRLINKSWPGPITLLLPTGGKLADRKLQRAGLYDRLCSDGLIGLRCPDLRVAQQMLSGVDGPVVAPSANLAGEQSPRSADEVLAQLDGQIDMLLDSGPTQYGTDSTIVRFADDDWRIVRQGVYERQDIRKRTCWTVMFVCTGNTCRSPMAAGIAGKLLAERFGCRVRDLPSRGVDVISAGLFAGSGAGASPEAIRAARAHGADISRHRAQNVTIELINSADLIFCMEDLHRSGLCDIAGDAADRIRLLDGHKPIGDPVCGGAEIYAKTADRIEKLVRKHLDREVP